MGTVTLLVLVLAFTSTTVARSKVQFTRFRSWNSRMYPVWRDGDSRLRNCWTGGNVSFEVRNDAPTLTGAKATFNIDLHFPTNQSVLPDGQVVWARNCTVDGRDYVEGQAVYADRASGSRGVGVFPDGSSFNRTQDRKPRYVFVWKTWGRFWQVADGPSSSLSIDTDNVPLGSYKMEVVIYHSRGDDQFIPLGYASTQFSITDQIPFTISLNQINDVNQNDQSFIQNRAIAFNVRLHDPSQYLGSSDITFNWDFGDQTGTLISRDLSVTHTYLSPGAYKPKVVLMATIPNACAETTAVAPVAPVVVVVASTPSPIPADDLALAASVQPATDLAVDTAAEAAVAPAAEGEADAAVVPETVETVEAVVAPGDEEALVVPAAGEAVEVVLTPGDEEALVVPAAGEAVEVVLAPGDEEVVEAAVAPAGEEAVEAAVTPATVEAVEAVVVAGDEVAVEAAVVVPEAEDAVVAAVVPAAEEADEAAVAAAEGEVVEAAVAPEAEEVVEAAVAPEAEEVVEAAVAPEAEAVVEAAVAAVDEAAVPTDAAAVAVAVDGVAVEAEEALVVEAATEAVAVVTEAAPAVNVLVPAATESTAVVVEAAAAVNAEAEVAEVEFNEGAVPTVGVVAVELAAEVEVTAENEPAQVALVLTKRQAPEAPADCTVYRYGSLATSVEIIQGIESVEILQVSNVVSLTTELGQNAVDLTISCQGSLPSEVCTVVSDADCVTPVETVCGVALPSPDCQLVLRQFFNGSGEFCVNVSLTNDVSLAVTSARVSVTVGSSGSPAGTAATVLGVMVIVGIMGTIGLMYRRVKQYQPLREEGEGSGVNTITSVPLLLWNLLSRQSPGESRPLLQSRGV
ncbi:premelanosome protein a isoform X3 [Gadus morhua]|uniref:premelanosome protein a isoform X2 n=1 Tax=Gadus morhua TaxID=8049 RepID=UPI0011B4CBFA|nr:melanocyte protein PMEL-like isoform X2 [Gadus morhua]XP_030231635.1 melanocyte protein PMEL-like isoform X3 [Gadus morhua]